MGWTLGSHCSFQYLRNHNGTQPQRERYMNLLYLRSVDENRQAPPLSQRSGYLGSEKGINKSTRGKKTEHKLGRTVRRRTSSAILLIQLVTMLNMVEFVFLESKLAEMAPAQLAGRQVVRTMVSETTSNSRFRRSQTSIQETGSSRLKTTSSTLSPSTRKSDRSFVLVRFFPYRSC